MEILEKKLIEEIQGGNIKSFEEMVKQYQDYIYSLCLGIVRDQHMAADITQDVFVKIYQSMGQYEGKGFKTWISRIATNQSIDYIRKRTKDQEKLVSLDSYKEVISIPETPESMFLEKDQKESLLLICEALGSKYTVVMEKYYIENKSYSTIALEENISIKTVESRLYRARGMIRKRWEEEGHDRLS